MSLYGMRSMKTGGGWEPCWFTGDEYSFKAMKCYADYTEGSLSFPSGKGRACGCGAEMGWVGKIGMGAIHLLHWRMLDWTGF